MPAFNSEATIGRAIKSVLEQKSNNWELIIVDDGSMDKTASRVSQFLGDNRIKYFYQENSGPGTARNNGISKSSGDWICFLDSDDYWSDDFLKLIELEIKEKNPDVVFYNLCRIKHDGSKKRIVDLSRFSKYDKNDLISFQMTGLLEWGMTKAIKTSIIKTHNLSFGKTSVAEEALFSFDVLFYSNSFSFIDKPIYFYVQNDTGQHKKGSKDPWHESAVLLKKHLTDLGCSDAFRRSLNSFAAKSFTICMYRTFISTTYKNAKLQVLFNKKTYLNDFDIHDYESKYLDKSTVLLLKFVKINWLYPIYVASKLRSRQT